ncbi:FtsK/SpoIIIE domain-containing protein [Glutamicibacter ardleyensis]|uniref:FtsK/SpoIIIE domain-containing protein n=1 Tax=Glutamicibacter ardleyensis TaxID=225894 RepID=UPI003FD2C9C8
MARRRTSNERKPYAVLLTVFGFILMVSMGWFGIPGIPFLWVALIIGALGYPPFIYTGKKDKSGRPTPFDEDERDRMRKYRFWVDMRSSIVFRDAFAPGTNVLLSWLGSLIISVAVLWVPVNIPSSGSALFNAICAFLILTGWHGSRRRTRIEGDTNPGVRVDAVIKLFKSKERGKAMALGIGGLFGGMVLASIINVFRPVYEAIFTAPTWSLYLIFGLGLPLMLLGMRVRHDAIKHWKIIVEAREEWRPRWQMLNFDPAPKLIDRQIVGEAKVDTFLAPASIGAQKFWLMASQIAPTIGGGMTVHTLDVHDEKKDGSPILGSRSPLKFDVAYWSHEDDQYVGSSDTPFEFIELKARCALAKACDEGKLSPRFVFESITPITLAPSKAVEIESAGIEGQVVAWSDPDAPSSTKTDTEKSQDDSVPMIYQLKWSHLDGADARSFLELATGEYSTAIGAPAVTDHRAEDGNGCLYFGELNADVEFVDDSPVDADDLDMILGELQWSERWRSASAKLGANPPRPEWGLHQVSRLANGAEIESLAFVTREGVTPTTMFEVEKELPTVLDAAPFVSMVGFDPNGTGGRHAMGIVVRHSNAHNIPASPELLAPSPGEQAPSWILAGLLNKAFKSARLARPELIQASCLTLPRAKGHIWKMDVFLHDGVTLSEVRGYSPKLRSALGCSWLRIATHPDGCTIIAGAIPNHDDLANPSRDEMYLEQLNWDQMFINAGLHGIDGRLPRLTGVSVLPKNPKVQVFEFNISDTGIEFPAVKEKVEKLKTVTENAWVDPMRDGNDATKLTLRVCKVNPMPEFCRYNFEYVDASEHLAFATGVEGEPLELNLEDSPHLLAVGATGGGKSVLLQALIYSILVRKYDLTIIDPVKGGADFNFAKKYAQAFTGDLQEARAIIRTLYEEVKARKDLNSKFGAGGYRELPPEVRPRHSVILIDEFTSLMMKEPVPAESDDPEMEAERARVIQENQWRMEIGTFVGKIAREARSAGFTLLLATQKLTAKVMDTIPGGNDLKTNMARAIAGNASQPERMSALRVASESPKLGDSIPKGRGLFEPLTSNSMPMQVWFEPGSQGTLATELEQRISPIPEDFLLDISRYMAQGGEALIPQVKDIPAETVIEVLDSEDIFSGFDWGETEDDAEREPASTHKNQTDDNAYSEDRSGIEDHEVMGAKSLDESSNGVEPDDEDAELLALLAELESEDTTADTDSIDSDALVQTQTEQEGDFPAMPYLPNSMDMVIPELLDSRGDSKPTLQAVVPTKVTQREVSSTEFDHLNFDRTFLVLGVEGVLLPGRPKGKTKSFSTNSRGRTRYRPEVIEMLSQHPQHMVLCSDEDDAQELREAIGHHINFVPAGEYMRTASIYLLKSRRRLKANTILVADQRLFDPSPTPDRRWVDLIGSYLNRPGQIHSRFIEVESNSGMSADHLRECLEWLGDMSAPEPDGVTELKLSEPEPWITEQVMGTKPVDHPSAVEPPAIARQPAVAPTEELDAKDKQTDDHSHADQPAVAQGGFVMPGDDW